MHRKEPAANASGFLISSDGVAVTNYHSLEDGVYALATFSTGESYPVESVLYYDTEIDIAVVRLAKTSITGKEVSAFSYLELAGTEDVLPRRHCLCHRESSGTRAGCQFPVLSAPPTGR